VVSSVGGSTCRLTIDGSETGNVKNSQLLRVPAPRPTELAAPDYRRGMLCAVYQAFAIDQH
jgi:hypothetical protein